MTTAEAFEAAVRADPCNESLRLVFADWLAEAGDAGYEAAVRADVDLAREGEFPHPLTARDALRLGGRIPHLADAEYRRRNPTPTMAALFARASR